MGDDHFASQACKGESLARPLLSLWDVEATLEHFAIVSYAVLPERVRAHVHPAFDLDCFPGPDGEPLVWVSMVPCQDQDFRFVAARWLRFRFGQTDYRTYVIDRSTGRRAVWFFGTTLDSWSVAVPRYAWRLPWHRGRVQFDCAYDPDACRYSRYRVTTRADWGPAELELEDSGVPLAALAGFADLKAGLTVLTQQRVGVYYRRDGRLGTYRVWHDRLQCTSGRVVRARIGLFDRLGLVPYAEQMRPHSVLLKHRTEFTIYLPPRRIKPATSSPAARTVSG